MRRLRLIAGAMLTAVMVFGLTSVAMAQNDDSSTTYRAELTPMNSDASGADTTGEATITVTDGELTIRIDVEGAPPDIQHWQHFHGFAEGDQAAACPTADADANGDGVVDLIETETTAGTTMVPFNDDPAAMDVPADTYPVADEDGSYTYSVRVSLADLQAAFGEAFPDAGGLNLENRVIFIHGVPEATELPDTVASLGEIPATTTLPIACGAFELVGGSPVASPMASPVS